MTGIVFSLHLVFLVAILHSFFSEKMKS